MEMKSISYLRMYLFLQVEMKYWPLIYRIFGTFHHQSTAKTADDERAKMRSRLMAKIADDFGLTEFVFTKTSKLPSTIQHWKAGRILKK